jgi:hypothetical protein
MAPAKAAYAATGIFFYSIIPPLQGCGFILASAVDFTHGY